MYISNPVQSFAMMMFFVMVVILGFIYEPALARWEQKMGRKMLKAFKKMRGLRK